MMAFGTKPVSVRDKMKDRSKAKDVPSIIAHITKK
jgi:hypothetical protein